MKKFLYIILAILGVSAVGYSVSQGWATFYMPIAATKSIPFMGYEFWQGITAAIAAGIALAVVFFKPKLALIPALVVVAVSAMFYFSPPVINEIQYDAEKMVIGSIVGGVLLAVAGLVAPNKA